MKLVIGKPEPTEQTLNLYLESKNGNDVCLMGNNGAGSYYLMTIHDNGKVYCHSCVSTSLGLNLDKDGRLRIDKK